MWVIGVDGCRGGWVAVALPAEGEVAKAYAFACPQFEAVLHACPDAAAVAVDMPIGLWESGRARMRPCDVQARRLLGKRASCVFIPPTRAMLHADAYAPLQAQGLSVQAYHLIPRIRELDAIITPTLQTRVWESHPELSFMALAGKPIPYPKRTAQGQQVRMHVLERAFHLAGDTMSQTIERLWRSCDGKGVRLDDLLDAFALAWSAWRHTRGQSEQCCGDPERDARGLQMCIRY